MEQASKPPYQIFRDVPPLREARREELFQGRRVGFVPTLGALHEGHLALIRQAAQENESVYVSIFLNPTQFGVNEDFDSYPKTWDDDNAKLRNLSKELAKESQDFGRIKALFAPNVKVMYPGLPPTSELEGHGSFVNITPLASMLEGISRPVFFRGVATVCMKLLNIVEPDNVYFGQKDIQQVYVVNRMVEDFHLNTKVRVGPTVREADGLALSSRNVYLGTRRRRVATVLYRALAIIPQAFEKEARDRRTLHGAAMKVLKEEQQHQLSKPANGRAMFEIDYVSIADPQTLKELEEVDPKVGAVLSGAIRVLPLQELDDGEDAGLGRGKSMVRLIDNLIMEAKP